MPEGLPYTWKTKMLGTICQLSGGYGFPDSFQGSVEGELPFIKVSDMSLPGNERDIVNANNYVSMRIANSMGWKPFPAGAVVFAKVGAALKLNRRRILIKPTLIDNNMMAAIPQGGFDSAFLYHFLCVIDFGDFVQDGALPSVNQEQVGSIKLPDIKKDEQRRIAEILDTIDEAIQKTEALISKLKAMKQGLLHDLLTRGLDKNGKLRDPKAHPEQFKDSTLGRIPHIWNIMAFRDVLAGIIDFRGKTPLKIGMKWGGGEIPALSANNVEMGRINLTKETYYGSKELYQHWMTAGDAAKGDVLMTLEAPLGNVAQIPDDRPYILSQRVVLFKTKDELMYNTFFRYQLTYEPFQCALLSESTGTTAKGIQRAKLEKLLVLVPPRYNEQELIVSKLEAIDTRISTEEQYRDKLKLQEKGLMHDLLTGKVRVRV